MRGPHSLLGVIDDDVSVALKEELHAIIENDERSLGIGGANVELAGRECGTGSYEKF